MPTSSAETILGIDPGLSDTGFGIIEKHGTKLALKTYGCIKTSIHTDFTLRLKDISLQLKKIIQNHRPSKVAVEDLFFYKNVSSALKVGQAKGAIISTCAGLGLPVYEYTPLQIKLSVVGYGRATKNQIQQMVKIQLRLKTLPKPDHSADAIAVAMCCAFHLR